MTPEPAGSSAAFSGLDAWVLMISEYQDGTALCGSESGPPVTRERWQHVPGRGAPGIPATPRGLDDDTAISVCSGEIPGKPCRITTTPAPAVPEPGRFRPDEEKAAAFLDRAPRRQETCPARGGTEVNPVPGRAVTAVMRSEEEMKAWAAVAGLALDAYETDGTEVPGRGDLPARFGVSPGTTRRVTGPLSGAGLVPGRRLCREDIAADPVLMVLAGAAMAGRLAALYPSRERSLRAAGREFLDAASLPGAGILLRHRAEDLPAEARSLIDAHLAGHGETGPAPPGISDRQAGECADRVMNWITAAGQQGVMRDPVRSTSEIITRTRDISPVIADAVRSSDASPAGGWLASAAVRAEVDRRLAARAPAAVRSLRPDRAGTAAPAARRAG